MREFSFPVMGEALPVHYVDDSADIDTFLRWCATRARRNDMVAVDSESEGLGIYTTGPSYLRLVQLGTADEAYVVPVQNRPGARRAVADALRMLPRLCGHNAIPFDFPVFDQHLGVKLEELTPKSRDSMFLAKLRDPRGPQDGGLGAGLKQNSAKYVDPSAPDTAGDLTAVFRSLGLTKETGWAGIPIDHPTYVSYAGGDVILASRLLVALEAELARLGVRDRLIDYEHEIAAITTAMTRKGMVVDHEYTLALQAKLTREEEEFANVAGRYGVENINATRQVADALLGMGEELTEFSEKTGAPKVDKAVLHALADINFDGNRVNARTPNPLAAAIIRAKRAGKWRSAYVDTFLEGSVMDGRVHPFVDSLRARTGRMAITRPALQTLPSGDAMIRRAMLAEPGHRILSCDFDGVEMRVLAALANVKRMKDLFVNGDGKVHEFTAELVYGKDYTKAQRKVAKSIGFGKVYGGGVTTVARQTGAPDDDIRRAMVAYDRAYPEIRRYSRALQREARQTGMVHVSVTGRRLPLDRQRTYAVVNYAVQSAARDVLGQSLINMRDAGLLDYLRLPIHDEVIASVPEREAPELAREVERCMNWDLFGVPITASAEIGGRSWGSLYGAAA